jgi:hypothetical protein
VIGLANMAHQLAVQRTGYNGMRGPVACCMDRESSDLYRGCISHVNRTTTAEYLRIIDRLTRGEKP